MSNDKLEWWTEQLIVEYGEFYREHQGRSVEYWGKNLLDQFKKSKQPKKVPERKPLFTTDDDVKVFEKTDHIYVVDEKDDYKCWGTNAASCTGMKTRKYFWNIGRAKEFIRDNKPVFSLNDIINHSEEIGLDCRSVSIAELKELAQSKINQP